MREKKILAALLAGALVLGLTACGGGTNGEDGGEAEGAPVGVAVQVEEISDGTIYAENTVSGQIVTEEQTTVMVATNAKCTAVYFEVGDAVRAGQAICKVDLDSTWTSYNAADISYQAAIQSYNDQSAVFESQITLLEKNISDLKELFEIGAASQTEIDQAELQLQSTIATRNSTLSQLEAGMQNYKSNLEQLSSSLENIDSQGNIIAPASGTLLTLNAVKDGYVSTAAPVAVIDGVDQLKLVVQVSEALVPKLSRGDSASVTISAVNKTFDAPIRSIERSANMQTKLYSVTLSLPADVEGLIAGMFADVTFHTDVSEDTVVVPTEAILTSGDSRYVFVVENGAARYVEVVTGLTGSGVTEVLSGLEAGQQLVTVGQAYLTDGAAVRIVSGDTPAETREETEEPAEGDAGADSAGDAGSGEA